MRKPRKMKSSKGKVLSRTATLYLGDDSEGFPITVAGKTVGGNNVDFNVAVGKLYGELKIRPIEAQWSMLSPIQKEMYKLKQGEDPNKFVAIFDETDPKIIEQKSHIINMLTVLNFVQYFDMDSNTIIDDNGNEINLWQDWGLNKKNGLLGVAKYVINRMEIPKANYNMISEEIKRMEDNIKTIGDTKLDEIEEQEAVLKEIDANDRE